MPNDAKPGDGLGRVEEVAARDDQVRLKADDRLDVDGRVTGDIRERDGLGRIVIEVRGGHDA